MRTNYRVVQSILNRILQILLENVMSESEYTNSQTSTSIHAHTHIQMHIHIYMDLQIYMYIDICK